MLRRHFIKKQYTLFRIWATIWTPVLLLTFVANRALANSHNGGNVDDNGGDAPSITNPLGEDQTLLGLLSVILDGIIMLMIPIIVLMVIYAGFLFVTAQGNEEKLTRAKTALLWTLVGALIILGANAILDLVISTVESLNA